MTWTAALYCPSCQFLNTLEGRGGKPSNLLAECRSCGKLVEEIPSRMKPKTPTKETPT